MMALVLSGAALSGELEMPVYMDFEIRHGEGGERREVNVHISFSGTRKKPGTLRMGVCYGKYE